MSDQRLFPLEYYGVRNLKSPGVQYNKKCCAADVNYGFGMRRQCKSKPGHGAKGIFCEKHAHLRAKDE